MKIQISIGQAKNDSDGLKQNEQNLIFDKQV